MVPGLAMQNRLGSLTLVRVLHHHLTFYHFEEGALGRVDVHKFVSGRLAEVHLLWHVFWGASTCMGDNLKANAKIGQLQCCRRAPVGEP